MMGLVRRSSVSVPTSDSEAATGVPRTLGVGVGFGVGTAVPGAATVRGVAVAGGRVGRGVSRFVGFSEVAVGAGAGGGDKTGPHAAMASVLSARMGNKRCIRAARLGLKVLEIYGTPFAADLKPRPSEATPSPETARLGTLSSNGRVAQLVRVSL